MPKMTTEQFLSHLGIEVGKPFNVKGKMLNGKYIIVYFEEKEGCREHYSVFDFDMNDYEDGYGNSLEVLLDCEITPLPKYTLTEDEKAILRHLETFTFIERRYDNLLMVSNGISSYVFPWTFNDLFTFVEFMKAVSLDELRECL